MSSIVKGVKKIVKGIGKAVKGVVEGVKKVFTEILDNKWGKWLLLGAAVFLGGAAFGLWQSPWASINGAWAGGAATGAEISTAAATAEGAAAAAPALEVAPSLAAGESVAGFGAVEGAGAATGAAGVPVATNVPLGTAGFGAVEGAGAAVPLVESAAAAAPAYTGTAGGFGAPLAAPVIDGSGLVVKAIQGVGGWAKENPLLAAMGINAVASGLAEDPVQEAEKRRQNRLRTSMAGIGDVENVAPGDPILRTARGKPVYGPGGMIAHPWRG